MSDRFYLEYIGAVFLAQFHFCYHLFMTVSETTLGNTLDIVYFIVLILNYANIMSRIDYLFVIYYK